MANKTPGEIVLEHFHAPDQTHASWWINTDEMTAALTPLLEKAWEEGAQFDPDPASRRNPYRTEEA